MAEHFLTKSRIDLTHCIDVDGTAAIEQHAALTAMLAAKSGPDVAKLFAEPLISRGNDQAASTVSWYSDRVGQGMPMSKLDDSSQSELGKILTERLSKLKDLIDDADAGPLVSAALHIGSPTDIWAVDGHPVLINWGLLPENAAADTMSRAAHYQNTLGPYLPLKNAPPLTSAEVESQREDKASVAAAAVAAASVGAATVAATTSASAAVDEKPDGLAESGDTGQGGSPGRGDTSDNHAPRKRIPLVAWVPLLLLLLLFGGALAWLLIPGNRIFATDGETPVVTDESVLHASRQINRELEQRLADLRNGLAGAVCRADGVLLLPDGVTIEGILPPDIRDKTDRAGEVVQASKTPLLPPATDRVVVPDEIGQITDTANLLRHIDERTAMVLSSAQGELNTGTGFFVGPDLLVTNFHVVSGASSENIYVTNKSMGGLKRVELLKTFGPMDVVGADFALLRVIGVNQPSFSMRQNERSMRLQSVIAAGYPGDVLRTDSQFAALRDGQSTAVPELTVTNGTVNTEQSLSETTHAVVHSAPISTGNSGGPLVDMCGRVVGVNTFVIKGPMRNLNFALAIDDLLSFLAGTPADPIVSGEACQPHVARPSNAPLAENN